MSSPQPLPAEVRVAVIGAGFGGLAAAIRLQQAGIRDVVLLERGDDVGGTWRDNSYPGCACDVPSHLYSFSFAPNPEWSRSFSRQPEIQDYLRRCATDFGLWLRIHLDTDVTDARWDEAAGRWRVTTSRGELTAQAVIAAQGPLSAPSLPRIAGLADFAGVSFHSARWRHDVDLAGKRVAVIGTGASAIQFVPHLQKQAGQVTVFQRTAPWVVPRRDRAISEREKQLFRRVPAAQKAVRGAIYWGRELMLPSFTGNERLLRLSERMARRHLETQVPDPQLRARLTPHFRLGCKRVLLSNHYYPALTQPNVELVTDAIVEADAGGLVTRDAAGTSTHRPFDVIIYGTGFHVTDMPLAAQLTGREGRTLREVWDEEGMTALRGTTVAGFPNLFLLVGPNTGLGHSSIIFMIESQLPYVIAALQECTRTGAALEPRPEVQREYNARLQRDLTGTVWESGGCKSWYLDSHGRNTTLWPTFTFRFRRQLHRFDSAEYRASPAVSLDRTVPTNG